jgi:hypothetical protein
MKRGSVLRGIFHASIWLIVGAALTLVAPYRADAQLLQGTIDGNVVDTSQAAVVGARVVATNQETNSTRER